MIPQWSHEFWIGQVSGSALAGPMLQEGSAPENAPPALHISGEMMRGEMMGGVEATRNGAS